MGISTKGRSKALASPVGEKIDSWKLIAAYLGRNPRTVQMWERSEGLPVHRLNHNSRSSVYAFTGELDEWMRSRSGEQAPVGPTGAAAGMPGESQAGTRARWAIYSAAALVCFGIVTTSLIALRRHSATPARPNQALAVLPFQDQTSMDSSAGDDLSNAVIADLSRIGKVPVISWRSVEPLKGSRKPLDQIAAGLNASLLLQGTISRAGDEVQVTVELVGEPGNVHQWGLTYTRIKAGSNDNEIATAIAIDVTRRLTGSAPAPSASKPAVSPQGRQNFLDARFYWNQRDLPGLEKAIGLYEKALQTDPRFADAYAGLAEVYDLMTDRGVMSSEEAFRRAKEAAKKALAIDPNCGEAYNALAFATYRADWDFTRAEQYFEKAIALSPDLAVAHQWHGEFLGDLRRFDASIAELRKARDLDPLSPIVSADLADGYLHAGRTADADAELQRVLDLYPDFAPAHLYRIGVTQSRGDLKSAQREAQVYFEKSGDRIPLQMLAIRRLMESGKSEEARRAAVRLVSAKGTATPSQYLAAQLLFETGATEEGYTALERAYREHSWWLVTMLVDPGFKTVRNQPRFLEMASRVGLPLEKTSTQLAMAQEPAK